MDNALKAIRRTDGELIVGNYIVLFGGKDLEGEFFTADTALESTYTKAGRFFVDWEHRQDKSPGSPGNEAIGYVDWSTAKADDHGVWVERTLFRHTEYVQFLEQLIDANVVGTSSEAVSERVQKGADGQIQTWPLMRDTLTVTPMEPRMITENVLTAFKALGIPVPENDKQPEPEAAPKADLSAVAAAKAQVDLFLLELDITEQEWNHEDV